MLVDTHTGTATRAQHKADNKKPLYPKVAAALVAKLHLPRATAATAPAVAAAPPPPAPPWEAYHVTEQAWAPYEAYMALARQASSEPLPFPDWQAGSSEQKALWAEYLQYRAAHAPAPGGVATSYESWLASTKPGAGAPGPDLAAGAPAAAEDSAASQALLAERQVWLDARESRPTHMVLSGVASAALLVAGGVTFLTGPSSGDVDAAYGRYKESPSTGSYASLSEALRTHNQHTTLGAGLLTAGVGSLAYFLYCVFDYAMAGTKLDHQPMPVLSAQQGTTQAGIQLLW
jgi:hypothetical protein